MNYFKAWETYFWKFTIITERQQAKARVVCSMLYSTWTKLLWLSIVVSVYQRQAGDFLHQGVSKDSGTNFNGTLFLTAWELLSQKGEVMKCNFSRNTTCLYIQNYPQARFPTIAFITIAGMDAQQVWICYYIYYICVYIYKYNCCNIFRHVRSKPSEGW